MKLKMIKKTNTELHRQITPNQVQLKV